MKEYEGFLVSVISLFGCVVRKCMALLWQATCRKATSYFTGRQLIVHDERVSSCYQQFVFKKAILWSILIRNKPNLLLLVFSHVSVQAFGCKHVILWSEHIA